MGAQDPESLESVQLAQRILELCSQRSLTLGCAESCTGGLLAAAFTSVPGSSACFKGGIVSYWPQVKTKLLGVSEPLIEQDGVVSESCALAMADGAARALAADITLATTGIAGPGGAEPGKPVGTVWIAQSLCGAQSACLVHARGDRRCVREQAVHAALGHLYASLCDFRP